MKKLTVLIAILTLAFLLGSLEGETDIGTVIVNADKFPEKALRKQIRDCITGETGCFSERISLTLYTDGRQIAEYREMKERLESWGADVVLRRETEENIFDFRSLGELSLYIWEGKEDDIHEAFLSKNSVFYSTGYNEKGYDELVAQGNIDGADALLRDNISVITK